MRVPLPANYVFPPRWQSRIVDIDYLLQPGGELHRRFRAAQELAERLQVDGIVLEGALHRIAIDYPELFPAGEASRRIIRAILCQTPPDRRCGFLNPRDVFHDEVPPYSSRFPRIGNSRRFRGPRPDREAANTATLLHLLARGFGAPDWQMPLTYRQIQQSLEMSSRQLHKRLEDIRQRARLTPTADREQWVALRRVEGARPPVKTATPVTIRCRDCDWSFEGTPERRAKAFAGHRAAQHPVR
jgi:hypothetical protein